MFWSLLILLVRTLLFSASVINTSTEIIQNALAKGGVHEAANKLALIVFPVGQILGCPDRDGTYADKIAMATFEGKSRSQCWIKFQQMVNGNHWIYHMKTENFCICSSSCGNHLQPSKTSSVNRFDSLHNGVAYQIPTVPSSTHLDGAARLDFQTPVGPLGPNGRREAEFQAERHRPCKKCFSRPRTKKKLTYQDDNVTQHKDCHLISRQLLKLLFTGSPNTAVKFSQDILQLMHVAPQFLCHSSCNWRPLLRCAVQVISKVTGSKLTIKSKK